MLQDSLSCFVFKMVSMHIRFDKDNQHNFEKYHKKMNPSN